MRFTILQNTSRTSDLLIHRQADKNSVKHLSHRRMRMTNKGEKKTVYRDSEDGQFVKKDYADKHPKTTEKERVPVNPPKKNGK
jgi:hypothetical protein